MFQSNMGAKTPVQLNELVDAMNASNIRIRELVSETDDREWDMEAYYIPNHAAIWNNIPNMKVKCTIMEKDDFIAVVQFEGKDNTLDNLMSRIYRLEDLTLLEAS